MRFLINMPDDKVKRLDAYADDFGVSRSALCSVILCQTLNRYDKGFFLDDTPAEQIKSDLKELELGGQQTIFIDN